MAKFPLCGLSLFVKSKIRFVSDFSRLLENRLEHVQSASLREQLSLTPNLVLKSKSSSADDEL